MLSPSIPTFRPQSANQKRWLSCIKDNSRTTCSHHPTPDAMDISAQCIIRPRQQEMTLCRACRSPILRFNGPLPATETFNSLSNPTVCSKQRAEDSYALKMCCTLRSPTRHCMLSTNGPRLRGSIRRVSSHARRNIALHLAFSLGITKTAISAENQLPGCNYSAGSPWLFIDTRTQSLISTTDPFTKFAATHFVLWSTPKFGRLPYCK